MKSIRPFRSDDIAPGASQLLLDRNEGADCAILLRRGGGNVHLEQQWDEELFALIIEGKATLLADERRQVATSGDLIFIPAGAKAWLEGDSRTVWIEIEASVTGMSDTHSAKPCVVSVDQSRFEGSGFAYQTLIDRSQGATSMKINTLQVEPGAGSPDYHIHRFAQMYVILEGEMTIDIGRKRVVVGANNLVVLPAGLVHRNFNGSDNVERHVSLLVPEPHDGEVFDYAVTIHETEAELLQRIPA